MRCHLASCPKRNLNTFSMPLCGDSGRSSCPVLNSQTNTQRYITEDLPGRIYWAEKRGNVRDKCSVLNISVARLRDPAFLLIMFGTFRSLSAAPDDGTTRDLCTWPAVINASNFVIF